MNKYKVIDYIKELNFSADTSEKEIEDYINEMAKEGWLFVSMNEWQMFFVLS